MSEIIKPKRGRKSKKELLQIEKDKADKVQTQVVGQTQIAGQTQSQQEEVEPNVYIQINEIENKQEIINDISDEIEENIILIPQLEGEGEGEELNKPPSKKRGRKPKGGKIIQQVSSNNNSTNVKPNIILHLKCSLKDVINNTNINNIESYNFSNKTELFYNIISNEPTNYNIIKDEHENENDDTDYDYDTKENDSKELWKKIKQLEHNLHINNVNDKKSACFWCTYEFDNPTIYIPKHFIKNSYHVYGCFCSPECAVAHLMEENIDSSTKFERYHLINHLYGKVYNYSKNIKPAPNPYYMLDKYYGNLSIQEYRSLFKNERLFLIVDKPLTRILPELHEDNDDFILNNKIIPSNNYQIKKKVQRKTQNKTTILNEKFGITNA